MAYVAFTREQRESLRAAAKAGANDGDLLLRMFALCPPQVAGAAELAALIAGETGAPRDTAELVVRNWDRFGGSLNAEAAAAPLNRFLTRWLRSNLLFDLGPEHRELAKQFKQQMLERLCAGAPCNREAAEAAIRWLYNRLGRPEPRIAWPAGLPTALLFLRTCKRRAKGRPYWCSLLDGKKAPTDDPDEQAFFRSLYDLVHVQLRMTGSAASGLNEQLTGQDITKEVVDQLRAWLEFPETHQGVVMSRSAQGVLRGALSLPESAPTPAEQSFAHILNHLPHRVLEHWNPGTRRPNGEQGTIGGGRTGTIWGFHYTSAQAANAAAAMGVIFEPEQALLYAKLHDLVFNTFWVWFGEHTVLCCEGPSVVRHGGGQRLHADDGPALMFGDGVEMYTLEGYAFPRSVVMEPDSVTMQQIEAERNADRRRILIARFGIGRYLSETGAEVLHMDMIDVVPGQPQFGSMPRALLKDARGRRWLVGTDGSTQRVYHMRVPREANTCSEAHTALAGFDESWIIASS